MPEDNRGRQQIITSFIGTIAGLFAIVITLMCTTSLALFQPNTPLVQNYMPSFQQQMIPSIPMANEINWRRIGVMAMIKLGLVKLKAIGFVKILLFFLFQTKISMIVVFFKFLSLLKFLKFFKFLILSLFVLPFLSIMASLIYPMTTINQSISPTRPTVIRNVFNPDSSSEENEEIVYIPGSSTTITRPLVVPNANIPDLISDAFNFLGGQRYDPIALLDPDMDFFRKKLNSEKCVERIVCKMAVTGKTGVMPLWINWMLHGITKSIPNDTFVYYLKAYDDVTNEINSKSPNPDNWEKWCFERYDCNNTNETNTTDNR